MTEPTRYRYEKRIKDLEDRVEDLSRYKTVALNIHEACTEQLQKGQGLGIYWILKQYTWVFR